MDARVRKFPSEMEIRKSKLYCQLCDRHMKSVSRRFVKLHRGSNMHRKKLAIVLGWMVETEGGQFIIFT